MKKWIGRLALGATLGLTMVGCAQERAPINRVQANALKKSFFVGDNLQDTSDDPEFWHEESLIDVGYGAGLEGVFTSGYTHPVTRIKWEITEDNLNARLTYERITDTDGNVGTNKGHEGQIVASFKITSHFDIKRAYNTSTGEELNVVEENSTDRPWYERDYFRVDWSKNLITDAYDFDTLSWMGIALGVQYDPVSYYVNDPTHPDAPVFSDDYFDVTQKVLASPAMVQLPERFGGGSIPSCFIDPDVSGGQAPVANCNPVELKIRSSFRRVVDNDYEPATWDGVRFRAFGAWALNMRREYEKNYGILDTNAWKIAERYNIWQKSHAYSGDGQAVLCGLAATDPQCDSSSPQYNPLAHCTAPGQDPLRDDDQNGTQDECEQVTAAFGPGSRCDIFTHKCTLPYEKRDTRTVVWYLNANGADDMFDPTEWAANEWDLALRTAVQTSRLVECQNTESVTGKTDDDCAAAYPMWSGQQEDNEDAALVNRSITACRRAKGWDSQECVQLAHDLAVKVKGGDEGLAAPIAAITAQQPMLVMCHNPVIASDNPQCGAPGFSVRYGDMRYNIANITNFPQVPSAWGIVGNGTDPLTGEVLSANVNVWNHVTNIASQSAVDIIRYINGEIPTQDITDGKYVKDWVQANKGSAAGQVVPPISKEQAIDRLSAVSGVNAATVKAAFERKLMGQQTKTDILAAKVATGVAKDVNATGDLTQSSNFARILARMDAAKGTDFEAQLINQPMLQAAGISPNSPVQPDLAIELASPLRQNNSWIRSMMKRQKEAFLANQGACVIDALEGPPEFSSIIGLSKAVLQKFPVGDNETGTDAQRRAEKMREFIARRFHYAVIAHEMGHALGSRHNFVSSYDAYTFRPQYWQARTLDGTVTTPCTDAVTPDQADTCVGPRYFDPVSKTETDNMIWMYQQSSIMEYPGDITGDMIGIGAYDYAHARATYGDVVSVFRDDYTPDNVDCGQQGASSPRCDLIQKTDSFGGILGITLGKDHYSQIQKNFHVIQNCQGLSGDPTDLKPLDWHDDLDGPWHPILDGHLVSTQPSNPDDLTEGPFTRCRTPQVAYTSWTKLGYPSNTAAAFGDPGQLAPAPVIDPNGRLRVPYAFASDNWADFGNLSVFRHDQGADPYEQFMFYIGSQENRFIFDHFRRNRNTFAIRPVMDRDWGRYTEKMMNTAKGLGLFSNLMHESIGKYPVQGLNLPFGDLWAEQVSFLSENVLAASLAMDHFSRQLTRPEDGIHVQLDPSSGDNVLRAQKDYAAFGGSTDLGLTPRVIVPTGTAGYQTAGFASVGLGGEPVENTLDETKGDYAVEYTLNAGSYYAKIDAVHALTESVDNFISQSRGDFVDARYRATSMADVFPDGFRRLIANTLTNDAEITGPRLAAQKVKQGSKFVRVPLVVDPTNCDPNAPNGACYPAQAMGWTSYWPVTGPETCWPASGAYVCRKAPGIIADPATGQISGFSHGDEGFNKGAIPAETVAVDPQVGWEEQKFIIAWTYLFLPENQRVDWFEMMHIYKEVAPNPDIFENKAFYVWRDPFTGIRYAARRYGDEQIFGKTVQKGIAARVLEYSAQLSSRAFNLDKSNASGRDANQDGIADDTGEVLYQLDPTTGQAVVANDPFFQTFGNPEFGTDACDSNRACLELKRYKSVPEFLREAGYAYHLDAGYQKGVY